MDLVGGFDDCRTEHGRKSKNTFLKINSGHKTSLHCHPQKKPGFIILSGKAQVQIGIYK